MAYTPLHEPCFQFVERDGDSIMHALCQRTRPPFNSGGKTMLGRELRSCRPRMNGEQMVYIFTTRSEQDYNRYTPYSFSKLLRQIARNG
jgi:hypothetical protein